MRLICFFLIFIVMMGCSSYLTVKKIDPNERVEATAEIGIPYQLTIPEFTIVETPVSGTELSKFIIKEPIYHADPRNRYTINIVPAWFTEADIKLMFNEHGNLLNVNSKTREKVTPTGKAIMEFISKAIVTAAKTIPLAQMTGLNEIITKVDDKIKQKKRFDAEGKEYSITDDDSKILLKISERMKEQSDLDGIIKEFANDKFGGQSYLELLWWLETALNVADGNQKEQIRIICKKLAIPLNSPGEWKYINLLYLERQIAQIKKSLVTKEFTIDSAIITKVDDKIKQKKRFDAERKEYSITDDDSKILLKISERMKEQSDLDGIIKEFANDKFGGQSYLELLWWLETALNVADGNQKEQIRIICRRIEEEKQLRQCQRKLDILIGTEMERERAVSLQNFLKTIPKGQNEEKTSLLLIARQELDKILDIIQQKRDALVPAKPKQTPPSIPEREKREIKAYPIWCEYQQHESSKLSEFILSKVDSAITQGEIKEKPQFVIVLKKNYRTKK